MFYRLTLVVMIALSLGAATAPTTKPFATPFKPVATEHLHNAHVVTAKVISGAAPEEEQAFKDLAALGVKTIISVDGAKPDIEMAKKYGMRYVHLPIGYDGVDAPEGKAIAKAINEMPGPIYVHCHHGKHRSAAAVAVACVYNASLKPEQAESVLQTFGTGKNYQGLWSAARQAKPLPAKELSDLKVDFPETAKISDLAEMMVGTDTHFDDLKRIQKAGWKAPADHPDLDPAHEALLVQEHLTEMGRLESVKSRPADFVKLMQANESELESLQKVLAAKPVDTAAADKMMKQATASCTACHVQYRD